MDNYLKSRKTSVLGGTLLTRKTDATAKHLLVHKPNSSLIGQPSGLHLEDKCFFLN